MNPEEIIHIAELAGEAILEIYYREEELEVKEKDDNSPLTEADLAAHNIIINNLKKIFRLSIRKFCHIRDWKIENYLFLF